MPSRSRMNRKVATSEVLIEEDIKEVQEEDIYEEEEEDTMVVKADLLFALIVAKWDMCHNFVSNRVVSVGTATISSMPQKIS
jgi:hypothetical protein